MKLISWNVAGINACIKKGLFSFISKEDADIYCFQEVKSAQENLSFKNLSDYHPYWFPAEKKGYSGLLTLSKMKPISVIEGLNNEVIDKEARVLTLEFERFFLINAYFPHAHRELKRLDFKLQFNDAFAAFCASLRKPLVIAADFNVAHQEIDLRNPKQNKNNAGFTPPERGWFDDFLKRGYLDAFRQFTSEPGHYTWWPYRNDCRQRNIGWRIDYFVVSEQLGGTLVRSTILKEVYGSDHCPIALEISL